MLSNQPQQFVHKNNSIAFQEKKQFYSLKKGEKCIIFYSLYISYLCFLFARKKVETVENRDHV
jgi:hypothetical protein